MKRTAAIGIILSALFLFALSAGAFAAGAGDSAQGGSIVCCGTGLYRITLSDHSAQIERTVPDGRTARIDADHPIVRASVFGEAAVALCNDLMNRQIVVHLCGMAAGVPQTFTIPRHMIAADRGFWYGGSEIFLPDESRLSVINRYSTGGVMLDSYDFGGADAVILSGYDSELYVLSDRTLYRFADGTFVPLKGTLTGAGASFIARDVLIDLAGNLYRVSDSAILPMFQAGEGAGYAAVVLPDGSVYTADQSIIYRYDGATGRRTHYVETDGRIRALYCAGGELIAVFESGVQVIPPERFLPCPEELPYCPVTSGVYTVDAAHYRITRIPSPTTFAQFKSAVSCGGYQAQLFRDGKQIASGNVGTAMTVVFSGADSYTFELSVIGDITGEGSVNSRDVGELIDYFLGSIRFDGVYYDAADLSGDGAVDLADLALLCRRVA